MIIFRKIIIEYQNDNVDKISYEQLKKMENNSAQELSPFHREDFLRRAALLKQKKIKRLN